jgi:hypothetical protein
MFNAEEREQIRDLNESRIRASLRASQKRQRPKIYIRQKRRRIEQKKIIEEKLGIKCFVCGDIKKVKYHEISGKSHTINLDYILKHIDDFIPLCWDCHGYLHRRFRILDLYRLALLVDCLVKNQNICKELRIVLKD